MVLRPRLGHVLAAAVLLLGAGACTTGGDQSPAPGTTTATAGWTTPETGAPVEEEPDADEQESAHAAVDAPAAPEPNSAAVGVPPAPPAPAPVPAQAPPVADAPYVVECLMGTPGPALWSDGQIRGSDYCYETALAGLDYRCQYTDHYVSDPAECGDFGAVPRERFGAVTGEQ